MLSRLSIRMRVTLVFAGVIALVLAAIGAVVYFRFSSELDNTINAGLRSRASDVAVLIREVDSGLRERSQGLVGPTESFAEVVNLSGKVLDSTRSVGMRRLLSEAELRRASRGPMYLDRAPETGVAGQSRLLAVPVISNGDRTVVIVGISIEPRAESLSDLSQLLLIGGPIALLVASLAAYWVAAAALRPVEAMRGRAAQISSAEPGERLPVPHSGDEIARLGDTLNAMLERLGEALAHQRRFVADASHELRTPLAILKAEVDLALTHGRSPSELREALASVSDETDRLIQLAEDLLTLAQTDQGELPIQARPTDVGEVLEGLARRFGRRAQERGRELQIDAPRGLRVPADRMRLDQALGNMLDNSLRYGAGPVTLLAGEGPGRVEIHVQDRGSGFDERFLSRAFARFSRAQASNRDGGSGLGLAIVEAIARAHHGEAHVGNRDGGGADVWLVLPTGVDGPGMSATRAEPSGQAPGVGASRNTVSSVSPSGPSPPTR